MHRIYSFVVESYVIHWTLNHTLLDEWNVATTKSRSNTTNGQSTHHHVRHAIWSFVLVSAVLLVVVKGKVFTLLLGLYNDRFKRSGASSSIEQMPPLLNTALLSDEGDGNGSYS